VRTGRGGLLNKYLQTETTPYPGFSGGPLIGSEGGVLGLNTSGLTPGSAVTIPVEVACRWPSPTRRSGGVLPRRADATVDLPESKVLREGRVFLSYGWRRVDLPQLPACWWAISSRASAARRCEFRMTSLLP
jgi:hypothetical protein